MHRWNLTPTEVIAIVRASTSISEVLKKLKLTKLRKSNVTADALYSWWNRHCYSQTRGSLMACLQVAQLPRYEDSPKLVPEMAPLPKYMAPPKPDETYFVEDQVPRTLLIVPDCHFPVQDQHAIDAVMEFIADQKPDQIVQLGDFYDANSLATFASEARRVRNFGGTLAEEAKAGRPFWEHCIANSPKVDFIIGNHEARLQRWTNEHIAFDGHPAMDFRTIFDIPDAVRIHGSGAKLRIGNIVIAHGDKLRKGGGMYLAANILKKMPMQNTFLGHFHRVDIAYSVVYGLDQRPKTFMAACLGWLGDVQQATYISDPNWAQAIAYIEFWTDNRKTRFTPHILHIVDGAFAFGGKVYGRKPLKGKK